MTKFIIAATFMLAIFLNISAFAANKVAVIPLGSTNVFIDPSNITSVFVSGDSGLIIHALTVPSNKHFVLTDLVGKGYVVIFENNNPKIETQVGGTTGAGYPYPNPITLSTGIVFAPGAVIKAELSDISQMVTISGYYY